MRAVALGVCGTDREIVAGKYGSAPPGQERLVLGHESLGRVEEAPSGSGFERGDLAVGIVRLFGSVNANRSHYEMALDTLMRANKDWLVQLITRRVPLERFAEALERRPGDIKVVIDFQR